jgi:hypothetical protein
MLSRRRHAHGLAALDHHLQEHADQPFSLSAWYMNLISDLDTSISELELARPVEFSYDPWCPRVLDLFGAMGNRSVKIFGLLLGPGHIKALGKGIPISYQQKCDIPSIRAVVLCVPLVTVVESPSKKVYHFFVIINVCVNHEQSIFHSASSTYAWLYWQSAMHVFGTALKLHQAVGAPTACTDGCLGKSNHASSNN